MTHGQHTAGVTGFLHAHHLASIVAATAVVGGGVALGAAWHTSQPASTQAPTHVQATQHATRTAGQVNQWMGHHHAYHAQLTWLRHHGYRDHTWMAHYRAYHHQLDWMVGHRAYAHGHWADDYRVDVVHYRVMHGRWMWIGHARAYNSQLAWLRHHDYRGHGWMSHYRGYHHQLDWMLAHRAYGHMPNRYRAYQARIHWLRDHRGWNRTQIHQSTWYRHNHTWMSDHMSGDWGMNYSGSWQ